MATTAAVLAEPSARVESENHGMSEIPQQCSAVTGSDEAKPGSHSPKCENVGSHVTTESLGNRAMSPGGTGCPATAESPGGRATSENTRCKAAPHSIGRQPAAACVKVLHQTPDQTTSAQMERTTYHAFANGTVTVHPPDNNMTTHNSMQDEKSHILMSPFTADSHTDSITNSHTDSRAAFEITVTTDSTLPDTSQQTSPPLPPPSLNDLARMTSGLTSHNAGWQVAGLKPKRTKRRVQGQRTCGVCGDRAIAHNFGALTCETCKAFFRRNAHRAQELPSCAFDKACVINKNTRRFCTSCRMQKCFAIGMDPLLILDAEEKRALQERRKGKQRAKGKVGEATVSVAKVESDVGDGTAPLSNSYLTPQPLPIPRPHTSQSSASDADLSPSCLPYDAITLNLSPVSSAISEFYNPNSISSDPPQENDSAENPGAGFSGPTVVGSGSSSSTPGKSSDSSQTLALGCRFVHVERNELPWDIQLYWPLTEAERMLLTQVTTSYTTIQLALTPPENAECAAGGQPSQMEFMMYNLEAVLRKSVLFAKAIPEFRTLREVDQIALLKASALKTYMLRSAALYIVERRAWPSYMGDVYVDDARNIFQSQSKGVDDFAEFCMSLKSVTKTNFMLYALLHCIVVFDVRDTQLEERCKVNGLKDKYLLLLKHYLESEYSYLHASRYMLELFAQLEDIHNAGPKVMFFYKQFSSFFRPLIAEFLAP